MLDQVSVISSQKLKPTLLNPSDLKLLLAYLEGQLVSYSHLALPQWEGDNLWYMYKFIKLQSFMFSDTLQVVLHIPLVKKSLQFNLYRLHNIPLVYPVLKKSFKYSIQEEYLAIRSESQYIWFPQVLTSWHVKFQMDSFVTFTLPCRWLIHPNHAVMPNSICIVCNKLDTWQSNQY